MGLAAVRARKGQRAGGKIIPGKELGGALEPAAIRGKPLPG